MPLVTKKLVSLNRDKSSKEFVGNERFVYMLSSS